MILYDDIGMLGLDRLGKSTEQGGLTDTGHVLEADFLSAGSYHLVGYLGVVFYGVHRAGGDAEGGLRGHAGSLGPFHAGNDVAHIVQTAEDTGYIHTLSVLHFVLQLAHVVGHGIHAEGIQSAVEHMGLDAYLVERLTEGTDSAVGVLAGKQVHLLKGTTVGFHSVEYSHVDDGGGNALQLVLAGLEFARRLPHVSINETELDSLFHIY